MDTPVKERHSVKLYTDGACIGNPGPGGWGFILKHPKTGRVKEESGGEHGTTNNRMEITAVIRGLEALKRPCDVELFSDSQYVLNAITDWMSKWKRFGWQRSARSKAPVRNVDLWMRLDELLQPHAIQTKWVRGHNGHRENERCDELASAAAAKIAKTPRPPRAVAAPRLNRAGRGLFGAPAPAEDGKGTSLGD
ncbi:MAG: ribonuclease HI [Tepidisphaeraceae bacterium]|jgi:ribonuclease HI